MFLKSRIGVKVTRDDGKEMMYYNALLLYANYKMNADKICT